MSSSATTGVRGYQNFVNGKWESAASGETFPVYDPSREEVIAQVAAADAADVDRVVKAARAGVGFRPLAANNRAGPWTHSLHARGNNSSECCRACRVGMSQHRQAHR